MTTRQLRFRAAVVALVLATTGCGAGPGPAPATTTAPAAAPSPAATSAPAPPVRSGSRPVPSTPPGGACLTDAERAGVIRFPSDNGASIAGVVLGPPSGVGVVLAHQHSGDLCEWVPYARTLAGLGYTALAIDLNGFGSSSAADAGPARPQWDRDVVAAAGQLRERGAGSVALVGASLGGTAAVVAAAGLDPAPAAVVDLSGPDELSGLDGVAAAPGVTAPVLFVAAAADTYAEQTRAVARAATGAAENRLEIIEGSAAHGVALLDPGAGPQAAQVSALVQDFLRRHTGG